MITFKEYLKEMAQAMKGDYTGGAYSIKPMPADYVFKNFKQLSIITIQDNKLLLFKRIKDNLGSYTDFVLGYFDKNQNNFFIPIFAISLEDKSKLLSEYPNLKVVKSVYVKDENQKTGIAIYMYKYLVNDLKYDIMGDSQQYFGARKLWAKLSKDVNFSVDIVNIKTKEIIEYGVKVHQGLEDSDFDKRIWSYDRDKDNIRLILTKILY